MKSHAIVGLGAWFLLGLGACSGEAFEAGNEAGSAGMAGTAGSAGQGVGGNSGQPGAGTSGTGGSAGSTSASCGAEKFRCESDVLYVCDPASNSYVKSQPCDAGTCNETLGRCDSCVAGAVLGCFNENTLKTCKDDGSSESTLPCTEPKPFCDPSGSARCVECRTTADCKPLTDDCSDALCQEGVCVKSPTAKGLPAKSQQGDECQRKDCDGAGGVVSNPLLAGTPCGSGGFCNGKGACGECAPEQVQCAGTASTHQCNEEGQWEQPVACPTSKPACSAASCVGVVSLASGADHSCSLMTDGTVRCWGNNASGHIGVPTDKDYSSTPVEVPGMKDVMAVQAGFHQTCALTKSGDVYCWGIRLNGSLGDGFTTGNTSAPTKIFEGAVGISTRTFHSCLVDNAGGIHCWGMNKNQQSGQVGVDPVLKPTKVDSGIEFAKISVGDEHSCALSAAGDVYCWGSNASGKLGAPAAFQGTHLPRLVEGLPKIDAVSVGYSHVVAREKTEGVPLRHWFWGSNSFGQGFQADSEEDLFAPAIFDGKDGKEFLTDITAGNEASFGLYGVFVFGRGLNNTGQLGNGEKSATEGDTLLLETPANFVAIAPGEQHTCALQSSGKVFCWGQGSKGQLGHGDTEEHLTPVEVIW